MFKPAVTLTMDNAGEALAAGLQAIAAGESAFDLSGAVTVDSSAVAVMLEWRREAARQERSLHFGTLPPNLRSLIDLYGVAELLPVDLRHH